MPKDKIDEALQSIRRVMKDKGIIGITLKKGEGEHFIEGDYVGMVYKRFFSFFKEDEFTEILKRNGFEVLESYETEHSNKPWLVFFATADKSR